MDGFNSHLKTSLEILLTRNPGITKKTYGNYRTGDGRSTYQALLDQLSAEDDCSDIPG